MGRQVAMLEPVIVDGAQFHIERVLGAAGTVAVRVGDLVEPDSTVASAAEPSGRVLTLHLARELGVAPDTLARYLTKPIGSSFQAGDAVARARRGLRSVVATAPAAGTLTALDEVAGTASLVPGTTTQELKAGVYGQVESAVEGRGVVVRCVGARVRAPLALGRSTWGPLKVAIDRPDRELTPDGVTPDLRDAVVLGGMTLGSAAMRRLAEVGARAVVVGSVSEAEVRRALTNRDDAAPLAVWRAGRDGLGLAPVGDRAPLTILVTEGFGRRPMAAPIFQFLTDHEGQVASVLVPDPALGADAAPELYFTLSTGSGDDAIRRASPGPGVVARLIDPQHLGTVVTCRGEAMVERQNGSVRDVVPVEFSNGAYRLVPLANLEILTVP